MKRMTLALLVMMFTSPVLHADSRGALLGNSQLEREIHWAWRYVQDIALSCLASKADCKDTKVREVVTKLAEYTPAYPASQSIGWDSLLKFVSEKDHPDLFNSSKGEAHRVAVTALAPNSTIYINTDRMNNLTLTEWVGLLAHEATHHIGVDDDDSRLPDIVGAELAKHFKTRALESKFSQFGRQDIRNLVFNSNAKGHLSIGFFSAMEGTYDIEWGASIEAVLCDPSEKAVLEFVGSPSWKVNRLQVKKGIVSVRGGGFVNILCEKLNGGQQRVQRLTIAAGIDLQYHAPLALRDWQNETPTLIQETMQLSASNNPADFVWGTNQSFVVLSVKNQKDTLQAGDTWYSQLTLQSLDESFKPTTCEVFYAGTQWSYWKQNRLPALAQFDKCAFADLGNGKWQVDVETKLPANMRADDFYIPLVRFPHVTDRFAVPLRPQFVKVLNSSAPLAPTFEPMLVTGISPLAEYNGDKLKNSYEANANQEFTVELKVIGPQEFNDLNLDLEFWTARTDGNEGRAFYSGPVGDMKQIILNSEITKSGNVSTIRMTVKMPAQLAGYKIRAMRFARFYMRASDFSWSELENADFREALVVNKN